MLDEMEGEREREREACLERKQMYRELLWEHMNRREDIGGPGANGRLTTRWILEKQFLVFEFLYRLK
jgi:hypothetical protein